MSELTIEKIEEARKLLEALAPKKAPDHVNIIHGVTGLKIYKNELLTSDSIMLSSDLFGRVFECAHEIDKR